MPMRMTPFKQFKKNLISYMKINVDIGPNKINYYMSAERKV